MDWLDAYRQHLERTLSLEAPPDTGLPPRCAAVSVLLAPGGNGPELLLIRRAVRPTDPWSGHMALPGGHRERTDATLLDTAIRETHEEVGVDLREHGELLGLLADVQPVTAVPILVRPFVFALREVPEVHASEEVDAVVWANLAALAGKQSLTEYELVRAGQTMRFPAFQVGEHVVWGLTYRIVGSLLAHLAASGPTPATDRTDLEL